MNIRAILSLLIFVLVKAKDSGSFIHPGLLHSSSDLLRMRSMVTGEREPWNTAFLSFAADSHSSLSYSIQGPDTIVTRDRKMSNVGNNHLAHDSVAALQLALMYSITSNVSYAALATRILVSWTNTLTIINGSDAQLAAALSGTQLVNAAEIIRYTYSGWSSEDIFKFENMLVNIFYPPTSQTTPTLEQQYPFEANWGTSGEKAIIAFGIFLNNRTMYQYGKSLINSSKCANLTGTINPEGQASESGRDQAHTQLGIGNLGEAFQMAWNQGEDLFSLVDNRLLAGFEYTAKYNLGYTVPYNESFYRCDAFLVGGPWPIISNTTRGMWRPIWELPYAHYGSIKGLSMPFTLQQIKRNSPDGPNPANAIADNAAWETLRFRLDPTL
ncbi:unnamed protein product [Adineta ricciae]|uniref:Alginate lyase domain-containing protein n=1 Tax=Adineta ricciae TaxID=249248 RepID=A0A815E6X6_ADIRI|nr:unnamed protein product [Adineta ricciae]CAF1310951.1 unnamed protein product [Adineta ricciae]